MFGESKFIAFLWFPPARLKDQNDALSHIKHVQGIDFLPLNSCMAAG